LFSTSDTAIGLKCANYPDQQILLIQNMFVYFSNSSQYILHVFFSPYNVPFCVLSISLVLANSLISPKRIFFSLQYHLLAISLHGSFYMGYPSLHCQHVSKRHSVTCANLLSNTAQALTSFVEALQDASNVTDPLPFLEEALDLFQKCLEHQELQHQEFEEQSAAAAAMGAQEADTDDGGVSLTTGSTMDFDSENGMYSPPMFECSASLFNLKTIFVEHKSWNMQIPFF
jgi:hypothetical protein